MHKKRIPDVLRQLMKAKGVESPAELARQSGVPQPTVHRVLSGESRSPDLDTLNKIGKPLGASAAEILNLAESPPGPAYLVERGPGRRAEVPVISWVRAGNWLDAIDNFHAGDAEEWLLCPVAHGACTFALRIRGDSMDNGLPSAYRDGEIIFVDPDRQWKHNSDVIVRTAEGNVTFKRWQETPDGQFLLALNEHYPERIQRVPEGSVVCGVVIFSGQDRRR